MSLALLFDRNTPLECGFSPAKLLYNNKLKLPLPMLPSVLNENVHNSSFLEREIILKEKSKKQFDKRHRNLDLLRHGLHLLKMFPTLVNLILV